MTGRTLLSILLFIFYGCSASSVKQLDVIRIKGSDTMLLLNQKWAEEYMKMNPGVSIYYSGGGSESGISALIEGETDICASSRPIEPEEVKQLAKKYNSVGMSFTVAKDALSIFLNLENPVSDLSVSQLKKIFTGEIKNWKEAGGNDEPVYPIVRPNNSGSSLYFKEHILDDADYSPEAVVISETGQVVNEVMKRKNAIGYGGFAYSSAVVNCSVNGTFPTIESIQNDSYPITRYLYLYTVNQPEGETKKFLDWVISKEGQALVKKAGYIPLW